MINLGVIDLILVVLFVLMIYLAARRGGLGLAVLIAVLLVAIILERLVPGVLAGIGSAIRGIDQLNTIGPHLEIQPVVRFQP